jgi:hypothetical protein
MVYCPIIGASLPRRPTYIPLTWKVMSQVPTALLSSWLEAISCLVMVVVYTPTSGVTGVLGKLAAIVALAEVVNVEDVLLHDASRLASINTQSKNSTLFTRFPFWMPPHSCAGGKKGVRSTDFLASIEPLCYTVHAS